MQLSRLTRAARLRWGDGTHDGSLLCFRCDIKGMLEPVYDKNAQNVRKMHSQVYKSRHTQRLARVIENDKGSSCE